MPRASVDTAISRWPETVPSPLPKWLGDLRRMIGMLQIGRADEILSGAEVAGYLTEIVGARSMKPVRGTPGK